MHRLPTNILDVHNIFLMPQHFSTNAIKSPPDANGVRTNEGSIQSGLDRWPMTWISSEFCGYATHGSTVIRMKTHNYN